MLELVINLHMHTRYSDGSGTHAEIAQAALKAGLDAVIVTDHNVLVSELSDYYRDGDRRVLLLIGEEIHDTRRDPQKNHLLVFGANRDLVNLAEDPQRLIDGVQDSGVIARVNGDVAYRAEGGYDCVRGEPGAVNGRGIGHRARGCGKEVGAAKDHVGQLQPGVRRVGWAGENEIQRIRRRTAVHDCPHPVVGRGTGGFSLAGH